MSTRKQQKSTPKKRNAEVFSVRIEAELIDYLRALAARERRTVAMELEIILEDYRARQEAARSPPGKQMS